MSAQEMSNAFSIKTMWRSFLCALMATVTLSTMNPFRTGKLVLFQVTYDRDWHFFEIIFFVILGIFGVSWLVLLYFLIDNLLGRVSMVPLLSSSIYKPLLFVENTCRIMGWQRLSR